MPGPSPRSPHSTRVPSGAEGNFCPMGIGEPESNLGEENVGGKSPGTVVSLQKKRKTQEGGGEQQRAELGKEDQMGNKCDWEFTHFKTIK